MSPRSIHSGELLKEARERMGCSQLEVATLVNIQIRQYQRFEYGERDIRHASMQLGLAICAVLGIDPFLLVFGQDFSLVGIFRER